LETQGAGDEEEDPMLKESPMTGIINLENGLNSPQLKEVRFTRRGRMRKER
jgi:hypothetical protein